MKQSISVFLIGIIVGLSACNTSTEDQKKTEKDSLKSDSVSLKNADSTETTDVLTREEAKDCVRGQAIPIIQKEDYPNTVFVLQQDNLTAFETVNFNNGDRLIIHNWGCEYYVLTFRFETTRFQQDISNLEYWFRSANELMTNMLSGIDAPIDIKKGIAYLGSYIDRDSRNNYKNLKLGEAIDFGINEIRDFVTVDRIEKLTEKKFAVEISFATGPL